MTNKEIEKKHKEINNQISQLKEEWSDFVWNEGIPFIIAKMKELNTTCVYLRAADDEGYIDSTEDLWGNFKDGYYAVKELKLQDDGKLAVVYTSLWNTENSNESSWGYEDDDMVAEVDREISDTIISNILLNLTDDEIYEIEPDEDMDFFNFKEDEDDEEDEEDEDDEEDEEDEDDDDA